MSLGLRLIFRSHKLEVRDARRALPLLLEQSSASSSQLPGTAPGLMACRCVSASPPYSGRQSHGPAGRSLRQEEEGPGPAPGPRGALGAARGRAAPVLGEHKKLSASGESLASFRSKPAALRITVTLGQRESRTVPEPVSREEEKLIQQELNSLKATVSAPTTTLKMMKECMVRLIYCEMLGYDASFGYIHAIKLAQQGNLLEKRVGYLAVSLFLHESHELLLLLVNTVVKDLQSTNLVEACMALTVVSQIFPREMIPAVLPLIEDKLQHSKEIIRRKAVLALYKFHLIAPNQVQHIHIKFRKALCDRDVGVMAASLHIYLRMIKENSSGYKDLTGSFVTILKQVVGGKLPVDFNYHSVPAPWLQIQLLRILGLLGKDDQRTSELMYDVLDESLRRAELNHNVTYAILFECVHTVYSIYPKAELLEKAAKCIGKFVLSPKINLKYLGLKALTYVVQQDPSLALQHQITIIECLDHPDPMIKREVLGEYSYLLDKEKPEEVISRLYKLLRNQSVSSETKAWLIAAVTKLTARAQASDTVERLIEEFSASLDTCMRQHAFELKHLHENVAVMRSLLPVSKSCEDMVVDASLSFLDGYVAEGLSQGAAPYKPHHQRQEEKLSQEKVLNFEPYGLSFSSSGFTGRQSPAGISLGSDVSGNSAETGLKEANGLKLEGVKKLWGKEGYLPRKESAAGQEVEAPPGAPGISASENLDRVAARRTQAQALTQSKEEKEKQLLASSLFVGLGSESAISLLGKADTVSHKFRRKSKVKEAKSGEASSAHNLTCSSLDSLSNTACEDNAYLTTLQDGEDAKSKDFPLSSELSDSESLSELPLAEKLSDFSLSAPSLFADSDMEIFQPLSSAAASVTTDTTSASCFLEETTEDTCSGCVEVCSDETVSVSSYKLWKDDCLLMVWSVSSKSGSEVKGANLDIFPAQNFKISTEDFGKLWLSFANDVKQNIKISESQAALPSALKTLQQKLRLHVVDIQGDEGLLACRLLPSTSSLLHCRVHGDGLALWFRSSCPALLDYLSCQCQKAMEGS
ncbi:AP-4 complex subunit epsilon-1 [Fukomys damarensis]|uniref:AP-4 complex subunit epsilon n=1 Tax=Fukomys damarensis TaxID=885580 RepID=A0A091E4F9_FUKDA|nr:AP-4 complex subunit epsilon-1 [Fukomys damarensis]